jgi:hypothetical protein
VKLINGRVPLKVELALHSIRFFLQRYGQANTAFGSNASTMFARTLSPSRIARVRTARTVNLGGSTADAPCLTQLLYGTASTR